MAGIPQKLYHYTSSDNADAIVNSGCIKATPADSKHAKHGPGVYLSDVPPSSSDKSIVTQNWGGQANPDKYETAIAVDSNQIGTVHKYNDGGRTVYKVAKDVKITGTNYSREDRK